MRIMLIQNINIYNFFSFFFKRAFTQKPEVVLKKKRKKTWNLTQFILNECEKSVVFYAIFLKDALLFCHKHESKTQHFQLPTPNALLSFSTKPHERIRAVAEIVLLLSSDF